MNFEGNTFLTCVCYHVCRTAEGSAAHPSCCAGWKTALPPGPYDPTDTLVLEVSMLIGYCLGPLAVHFRRIKARP